ncbi:MAG: mercury methylation ferredoxin HgcB [Coriobacteriia bacterium]|nr:mercury methylation ferredoxin HgcB [Coriobacteriia bacterium]
MRYIEEVVTLEYDAAKCTGCQLCTMVCPHGVFVMEGNRAALADRGACMECGACQRNCAFDAIRVDSGVGCAAAIIGSWFKRGPIACGPDDGGTASGGSCC